MFIVFESLSPCIFKSVLKLSEVKLVCEHRFVVFIAENVSNCYNMFTFKLYAGSAILRRRFTSIARCDARFWDDWMRKPEQRRSRSCIRPEIPRSSTFGRLGTSKLVHTPTIDITWCHLINRLWILNKKNWSYDIIQPICLSVFNNMEMFIAVPSNYWTRIYPELNQCIQVLYQCCAVEKPFKQITLLVVYPSKPSNKQI